MSGSTAESTPTNRNAWPSSSAISSRFENSSSANDDSTNAPPLPRFRIHVTACICGSMHSGHRAADREACVVKMPFCTKGDEG